MKAFVIIAMSDLSNALHNFVTLYDDQVAFAQIWQLDKSNLHSLVKGNDQSCRIYIKALLGLHSANCIQPHSTDAQDDLYPSKIQSQFQYLCDLQVGQNYTDLNYVYIFYRWEFTSQSYIYWEADKPRIIMLRISFNRPYSTSNSLWNSVAKS